MRPILRALGHLLQLAVATFTALAALVLVFGFGVAAGVVLAQGEDVRQAVQGCGVNVNESHGPDRPFFNPRGDGNGPQRAFPSRASTPI